jgi:hypothetical protein
MPYRFSVAKIATVFISAIAASKKFNKPDIYYKREQSIILFEQTCKKV